MKQFLKNKMNLGLVLRDGRAQNHRSLVKILLNPILRVFKCEIGTIVQMETNTIERCVFQKYTPKKPVPLKWFFVYPMDDNTTVKHIRCWF